MPQQTSPLSTPAGMFGFNAFHVGKYLSPPFPSMAAFTAAITPGTPSYSADLWYVGQRFTISGEPFIGYRVFNGTHAHTFVLGNTEILLGSDSSTVLRTSGAPTGGNDGDLAVDEAALSYYGPRAGGNWGSAIPFTATAPVQSVAGKTGTVTLEKADVGLAAVDNTSDAAKPVSTPQAQALANKADLVSGLVPSNQLPSYVDDVLEFANRAAMPATGESGKIYVALDTNYQYRWTGTTYILFPSTIASTDNLAEGSNNLYFTSARAKSAVVFGPYADLATLQSTKPAASNPGATGLVGSAAPYTQYTSNGGSMWLPAAVSGAGNYLGSLPDIIARYYAGKAANRRALPTLRSAELVGDTVYADSAALETAFPAAANTGKAGKVGSAGAYSAYLSDGTSYVLTASLVLYLRAGVTTTNYTFTTSLTTGITNAAPANGGALPLTPVRLYGAIPLNKTAGIAAMAAYNKAGSDYAAARGQVVFVTDEPKPIIDAIGYSLPWVICVDDGGGERKLQNPLLTPVTPYWQNASMLGPTAGPDGNVQLDFSQVGGRKRRKISFYLFQDINIKRVAVGAISTIYDPPASQKIAWFTDSLGATASRGAATDCFPSVVGDMLGVLDNFIFWEGSTGFVANASGTGRTHLEKLQYAATVPQVAGFTLGVIAASVNDGSNSASAIQAAAATTIQYALDTWPNAAWIVLGCTAQNTTANQALSVTNENAVAAAVAAIGSSRVAMVRAMTDSSGQAITGTGNLSSPAGNGTADLMFNQYDMTHFDVAGHLIWGADRMAPGIVAAAQSIISAAR